jgi:DNA-binding NarL/FixJ family response regulator
MTSESSIKKDRYPRILESKIFIVGPLDFQNELLAYMLKKETGTPCFIVENIKAVLACNETDQARSLLLMDCNGRVPNRILEDIKKEKDNTDSLFIIALFNLQHGKGIEQQALKLGINGFFYRHESMELFIEGVRALFRGEVWLARKILVDCVLHKNKPNRTENEKIGLTPREIEILSLIAIGTKNEDVAKKLAISPNTVKIHLYHAFKKINVPNRLQAALWATKNIEI